MSERYSKLNSLPANLYAEGAPVVISAGNLLKDELTGNVLAQLKIRNIASKTIKAATVRIHIADTAGKALEGDIRQEYLDLSVQLGDEFGQKTPIPIPDNTARCFSAEVERVVFADNTEWEDKNSVWESLPERKRLGESIGDSELVKQYRLRFGSPCEYATQSCKDLWMCACGTWNKDATCYSCKKEKGLLLNIDLDDLIAEKNARLAKEEADFEAAQKKAQEKAKKTKKALMIGIPAVLILSLLLLVLNHVRITNREQQESEIMESELIGAYTAVFEDDVSTEGTSTVWNWTIRFTKNGTFSENMTATMSYSINGSSITMDPTTFNDSGSYSIDTANDCVLLTYEDASELSLNYTIEKDRTVTLNSATYTFEKTGK